MNNNINEFELNVDAEIAKKEIDCILAKLPEKKFGKIKLEYINLLGKPIICDSTIIEFYSKYVFATINPKNIEYPKYNSYSKVIGKVTKATLVLY